MATLDFINGQLVEELVKSSKIIKAKFDGWDWHVLTERPKPTKDQDPNAEKDAENKYWKYAYFTTSNFILPNYDNANSFSLMSQHNRTSRDMLKKFDEEFYEAKFSNQRIEERRKKETIND